MPAIPSATSALDLYTQIDAYRKQVLFAVESINLIQVDEVARREDVTRSNRKLWRTDPQTLNTGRDDGLFYENRGIKAMPRGSDDSSGCYFQPIVRENGGPDTVILVCDDSSGDILLEMKTQAGADPSRRHTLFAPTLAVSSSRLITAVENKADPALPLLGALAGLGAFRAEKFEVAQDPGRFENKRNENRVAIVPYEECLNTVEQANLIWTKVAYLGDALNRHECNNFLWETLGLLALERNPLT